ncbi:methyltransferase [Longimycelium tulufanense]|uniref:Methyltransferase n=1 Tax=Longimycelium tulufanense TaxID=907463 RepID=A0A8J3CB11_9PSEU|nr:bis-aminopropyl spermidine synthase family protein [Longimycelium tulufanense]GGM32779.1 methyltransferase [Longimycelium tulufanense]
MSRTEAIDQVADHLAAAGVHRRRLLHVVALLTEGWHPLADLIRRTALPRRTVEELLTVAGDDVDCRGDRWRLVPDRVAEYRGRFDLDRLPESIAPGAAELAGHAAELAQLRADIAAVPPSLPALDHVPATPESVLRRALWLAERYDLSGARLLCLGDHDLTALAVCAVAPELGVEGLEVTVVDLDERTLEYIDGVASERGYPIRCLHADLRFGLPSAVAGWADLVFTDPPYTPEGVGLFAARALTALRQPEQGRVLIAYGFSERTPALGLKVQQELQDLGLAFEAILPAFDRYVGAQAVGSASDLYVCQPTAKSRKLAGHPPVAIYTHGSQSVEGRTAVDEHSRSELMRIAAAAEYRVNTVRLPAWERPLTAPAGSALALDATADPGPWLLRALMAANTERAAVLVVNSHPDLADEAGQRALGELLSAKFELRFLRSTPEPNLAIVVAEKTASTTVEDQLVRALLDRAHGKIANIWREALISASETRSPGNALTKNEARDRVTEAAERAGLRPHETLVRLVDLPRHRLGTVLAAVRSSVT